ncbi:MAG: ribbon-helix-helix protein, CopG family [Methylocystis sp.]|nr:ribbon-helix-helix protein, CopG family [Methylocystis sp.]
MPSAAPPTSIRLSEKTRKLLDDAARKTRRSRSFLVEETLKRHLLETIRAQNGDHAQRRLDAMLAKGGVGVRLIGEQSVEALEQRSREFRGNE